MFYQREACEAARLPGFCTERPGGSCDSEKRFGSGPKVLQFVVLQDYRDLPKNQSNVFTLKMANKWKEKVKLGFHFSGSQLAALSSLVQPCPKVDHSARVARQP